MAVNAAVSTSLSQLLVAFTTEVDEEFESVMPHSAKVKNGAGLKSSGPWLVSQVMWSNYLRHIDGQGTPVRIVQDRACDSRATIKSRLNHLGWWGYVTIEDAKQTKYPDQLVKLTQGGRKACKVFEPLVELVEQRWRMRFGDELVDELRGALAPVAAGAPAGLPRFMPVVDYGDGMRTNVVLPDDPSDSAYEGDDLSSLLSRALLRLTLDFEKGSRISLPHLANVLRVLDRQPLSIKDVPLIAGVSKQAIDASVTFLVKEGLVVSEGKGAKAMVWLTDDGRATKTAGNRRLTSVGKSWEHDHGTEAVDRLRTGLDRLLSAGEGPDSLIAEGLVPHDGSWRGHTNYRRQTDAVLADPRTALPHHPMVLHRGGFPDGS